MQALDAADQRELDLWQRHGLTAEAVRKEIAYFKGRRKYFADKLELFRQVSADWKFGAQERAEHSIMQQQRDLVWFDNRVAFLEWLLKQPRRR